MSKRNTNVYWVVIAILGLGASGFLACLLYLKYGDLRSARADLEQARAKANEPRGLQVQPSSTAGAEAPQTATSSQSVKDALDLVAKTKSRLAADWRKDSEFQFGMEGIIDEANLFPNAADSGQNDYAPDGGYHYYSIPSHDGRRVLRAYIICRELIASTPADTVCGDWAIQLWTYEAATKGLIYVATVGTFRGSNFGGLPMPIAWSKDDRLVILKDKMFSPGAGGSSVGPTFGTLDVAKGDSANEQKVTYLATGSARFYDAYGKVVYLEESPKSVRYIQPGPPNNGRIVYRNISGGQTKVLIEEPDTEYQIVSLDEKAGRLAIKAIHYRFGGSCPREDGNQSCAQSLSEDKTLQLP